MESGEHYLMRIGLFGGTFDPIHLGHLRVAEEVLEKKRLDRIIFIPAGQPPHRREPHASPEHRLAMVRQAVKKNHHFTVLDYEIKKPGKSYTIETIRYVLDKHPAAKLYLIIGADQWLSFPNWHASDQILQLCQIIVMSRPHVQPEKIQAITERQINSGRTQKINIIKVSKLDISSTNIRRRITQGHSIQYLVNPAVGRYIHHHHLYLPSPSPAL